MKIDITTNKSQTLTKNDFDRLVALAKNANVDGSQTECDVTLTFTGAYKDDIETFNKTFPNVDINILVEYIRFADPEVEEILKQNNLIPIDGAILSDLEKITSIGNYFIGNNIISSFDELGYTKIGFIGNNAFENCTNLKSVSLPEALKRCEGGSTFANCVSLEEITFKRTEATVFYVISMFKNCYKLKRINIPSLHAWLLYSFRDDNPLNYGGSLYIDGNIVETAIIPFDITDVYNLNSVGLKTIILHDHVTNINVDGAVSLEKINIEDSLITIIKSCAFRNTTNLKYIDLSNITTLQDSSNSEGCFCNSGIEKVVFSNKLHHLGGNGILGGCFANCKVLEIIIFNGSIEEWNAVEKINGWNYGCPKITVHCTDGDIIV